MVNGNVIFSLADNIIIVNNRNSSPRHTRSIELKEVCGINISDDNRWTSTTVMMA